MMGDLLQAVVAGARRAADERERAGRPALERSLASLTPRANLFRETLLADGVRVIAECKRRSPSRGVLRHDYDPAAIAAGYERAGAAAISVLTEPTFFDGSLADLERVRGAVSLPLLRKDFIVTDYQVMEAAAAGADAVLLIVAALGPARLRALLELARSLHLAVLVEVHEARELSRALDNGADIIGVNSRNLRTLEVDQSVLHRLGAAIPKGIVAVAESGLRRASDLRQLGALRYNAFLIGERFMTETEPGAALSGLLMSVKQGRQ